MIKAVSFDFDGTLVQSNEIKRRAFFKTASVLGNVDSLLESILESRPGDRTQVFECLVEKLKNANSLSKQREAKEWVDFLVRDYTELSKREIIDAPEISGAATCLQELVARNVPIFIVSATPKSALDEILKGRGWLNLFEDTYGQYGGKRGNLERILLEQNLAANELIHIGDQEEDAIAAREIGCQFADVARLSNLHEVVGWLSHV